MRGDFTRDTFDPARHFSRVLMQQGRVQLDADLNEQTAILLHYLRTLAKDILGPYAGPADAMGFEIVTSETPNWEIRIDSVEPDKTRQSALKAAINRGSAVIAPGRYYVHGMLVESERTVLYDEQPVYAVGGTSTIDELKNGHDLLFYLDVWERHITYVEDDRIREVTLGGIDTCSRAQMAWQVKVLPQDYGAGGLNCESVNTLYRADPGKLRARARLEKPPPDRCVISPESRFRGTENQLYRVEVQLGGTVKNEATFKWSRENGSVIFPIRSLSSSAATLEYTATLEHLGRDSRLGLKPGDWVEIVDEWIAMGEKAGPLARVDQVNCDDLSVALTLPGGSTNLFEYTEIDAVRKRPLLRRWDHAGDPKFGGALRIIEQEETAGLKSGWISLEAGVQISFAKGGNYRAGDFWLIPARVTTGNVEWPYELNAGGTPKLLEGQPVPAARPPHGPRHYYAPLLLTSGGQTTDCRCCIKCGGCDRP